ncbi:hypothetical protein GWK47_047707 [Chionoecetes opilio]|uniref:Uncharacterized protein n=1 Tax=Chionoecetes opilio TaxID=41210 RepID=A0A8J5CVN1_CHIOP|nr:hypothetical protein GWK47_047707 [Chionoecetes opilio]
MGPPQLGGGMALFLVFGQPGVEDWIGHSSLLCLDRKSLVWAGPRTRPLEAEKRVTRTKEPPNTKKGLSGTSSGRDEGKKVKRGVGRVFFARGACPLRAQCWHGLFKTHRHDLPDPPRLLEPEPAVGWHHQFQRARLRSCLSQWTGIQHKLLWIVGSTLAVAPQIKGVGATNPRSVKGSHEIGDRTDFVPRSKRFGGERPQREKESRCVGTLAGLETQLTSSSTISSPFGVLTAT